MPNQTLSPDTRVRITTRQLTCELDGESVILGTRAGIYYGLDAVGTAIWKAAHQPVAIATIVDDVLSQFDVERGQCERDVLHLLGELVEHELIVVEPQA